MKEYTWAANPFKLQRAIAAVGREDAAVKAEYVKLGGLLIEDSELEVVAPVAVEETAVELPTPEVSQEKPKKVAKVTKKVKK